MCRSNFFLDGKFLHNKLIKGDLRKLSAYLQMCTDVIMSIIRHMCCASMAMEPRLKKLLDHLREVIRLKHYAYRTEETYVQWVRRYILLS